MHYKKSIEVGFSYRKKVADNIKSTLKFVNTITVASAS